MARHKNSTFNILMYSHDTYGLGHIRRTMAIANQLKTTGTNILILTGSPIVGRFAFPKNIDFVRIPGMIKVTNEEYLPLSIKLNPNHVLAIREKIILATAKAFRPALFIVDKEPLGLKKEVLSTLFWMKKCQPRCKTILGLRDIMDDREVVRRDWTKKDIYTHLKRLYDEIWVYGQQDFYDPITEYAIPETVSRKMVFTGYIPRKIPARKTVLETKRSLGLADDQKLIVVTTGGGGDGFAIMDNYMAMLEQESQPLPFRSVLVFGPFMPKQQRQQIIERGRRHQVITCRFYRRMEELLAAADVVISMGGYNTICEILSQGTLSLVVPRETPRKEQLLRAQALQRHGLADFIPWHELNPTALKAKIIALLENGSAHHEAIGKFQFTGLSVMHDRIRIFKEQPYVA
ncbi:glycosyltransferase family protein [Desulfosarcina ovata]|uniref:Membrane protein n=2 Tax=Desulfosarcina ovata TaxID=83564 RepID=A0A5K8ALQ1_9BACT|nr:glycosyltransferase [Desulfosarcina ovata]BBO86590.1 membrane protein [Desulfosarcina ovata subsp. sediminis]BBO93446.1 membrane protein [Desulfosarcina ovata subsp. ovata]